MSPTPSRWTSSPSWWKWSIYLLLAILSLSPSLTAKAQSSCQAGQVCRFDLAAVGGACHFNEVHFFTQNPYWEIPAQGFDYFNYRFAPFTILGGGYQKAGKIEGGCLCDVSTWVNYVAKINGLITNPTSPGHSLYNISGVPNEFENGVSKYYVTVEHRGDKPDSVGPWFADLRVENTKTVPVTIRWQLVNNENEKPVAVDIWVENVGELSSPTETSATNFDFVEENTPPKTKSKGNYDLLLYLLILAVILGMIFSKNFRIIATVMILAFALLVIMIIFLS